MLIEVVTEWTSTPTGPLNPAVVTWGFDSPSGAPLDIELNRVACAIGTAMCSSVGKSALSQMQFAGAKWRPSSGGLLNPIAMTDAVWLAKKNEFLSAYRTGIPDTVPGPGTNIGASASYSGRGDSFHINKRLAFGGAGPKRGGAYLPFLAAAAINGTTGLIDSLVSVPVQAIWEGMMLRRVNVAWAPAGAIDPQLESVVVSGAVGNAVVAITPTIIPSRLRSRLR